MRWEYQDRMVMFTETPDGLASGLDWLGDVGQQGWELVGAIPLIAPNKDGVAYGTVGVHLIFKRPGDARRSPPGSRERSQPRTSRRRTQRNPPGESARPASRQPRDVTRSRPGQ